MKSTRLDHCLIVVLSCQCLCLKTSSSFATTYTNVCCSTCSVLFIISLLHGNCLARPQNPKIVQKLSSRDLVHYSQTSKRQFTRDPFVKAVRCVLINEARAKERGNVAGRNWNWNVLTQSATSCLVSLLKKIDRFFSHRLMPPNGQIFSWSWDQTVL